MHVNFGMASKSRSWADDSYVLFNNEQFVTSREVILKVWGVCEPFYLKSNFHKILLDDIRSKQNSNWHQPMLTHAIFQYRPANHAMNETNSPNHLSFHAIKGPNLSHPRKEYQSLLLCN